MAERKIQVGQVWKKNGSGEEFLVTKVYSEAFSTFAMLSKAGEREGADNRVKVRVEKSPEGQTLPGFVFAQEEVG